MKIKREIGGIEYEFELTYCEGWKAWNEWQNMIAREEAEAYMEDYLASRDDDCDITEADVEAAMDEITERYRELMDGIDGYDSNDLAYRAYEYVLG